MGSLVTLAEKSNQNTSHKSWCSLIHLSFEPRYKLWWSESDQSSWSSWYDIWIPWSWTETISWKDQQHAGSTTTQANAR